MSAKPVVVRIERARWWTGYDVFRLAPLPQGYNREQHREDGACYLGHRESEDVAREWVKREGWVEG